ncbi:hypothetical protein Nepgr_032332 [Nepenthes gracilis]|uniref:Uncharacterized protein n=1 Tax=Nepenthes gracilis TaxID=150966 RepID=A0AAD3TJS8_NEPGR|nr:hypothetical protein Nepgr_032332 [Nepenthes gracilis]
MNSPFIFSSLKLSFATPNASIGIELLLRWSEILTRMKTHLQVLKPMNLHSWMPHFPYPSPEQGFTSIPGQIPKRSESERDKNLASEFRSESNNGGAYGRSRIRDCNAKVEIHEFEGSLN